MDRVLVEVVDGPGGVSEVLLSAGRGGPLRFPLRRAHPNRPVRFAVGRPGRRSSMWRLWANQRTDPLARTRREQRAAIPDGFDLDPASGPRAAVITVDGDGYRNVWDLTLS